MNQYKIPDELYEIKNVLVERENIIKDLVQKLQNYQCIVLKGCQGVGKTYAAWNFLDWKRKNENATVRMFDASSKLILKENFLRLAKLIGFDSFDVNSDNLSLFMTILNHINTNISKNIYFVYDNVLDFESVKEFLLIDRLPINLKVLVTTKNENLSIEHAFDIKLDAFDTNYAFKFIRVNLPRERFNDETEKLFIDALLKGNHSILPIVLNNAVSYLIQKEHIRIRDYVHALNRKSSKEYSAIFFTFEDLSLDSIYLLNHIAYLDNTFIHNDILIDLFDSNETKLEDTIKNLQSLSLIERIENGFKCHDYIINQIKSFSELNHNHDKNEIFLKLFKILSKLPEIDEDIIDAWKRAKIYGIHLDNILTNYNCNPNFDYQMNKNLGLFYLIIVRNFNKAVKYLSLAIEQLEFIDSKNLLIGFLYIKLADSYRNLNENDLVREKLKIAIEFYKKYYFNETENMSHYYLALNNFALSYLRDRQLNLAHEFFNQALDGRKRIFGELSLSVALTLNNIGCCYEIDGQYDKALELQTKSLEIRRKLDTKPEKIAFSLVSLGKLMLNYNKFKDSLEYYTEALEINETVYKDQINLSYAYSLLDIGKINDLLGFYKKALDYKLRALKVNKSLFSEHHVEVIENYSRIGDTYFHLGLLDCARSFFDKGLKLIEKKLMKNEQEIFYYKIDILTNKAKLLDKELSLNILDEAYVIAKDLKNNQLLLPNIFIQYGQVYFNENNFEKALENFNKAKEYYKNMRFISNVEDLIGSVLYKQNKLNESLELKSSVLNSRLQLYNEINPNHPHIAQSLNDIGKIYEAKQDYLRALDYYEQSFELRNKNYQGEHIEIVESLNNMSRLYSTLKNEKNFKEFNQKAEFLEKRLEGKIIDKRYIKISINANDILSVKDNSLLGEGSSGKVYLVEDIENDNKKKALKVIFRNNAEIEILTKMSKLNILNPYIVKINESGSNYLVLEYCEGGSLCKFLEKVKLGQAKLENEKKLLWFYQLISALKYIHEEFKLIHFDVNPKNILISENKIKLSDFGLASSLDPESQFYSEEKFKGTPNYFSPEIIERQENNITFAVDIWSAGCVLFELFNLEKLFNSSNQYLDIIIRNSFQKLNCEFNEINQLFERMLIADPRERISSGDSYEVLKKFINS